MTTVQNTSPYTYTYTGPNSTSQQVKVFWSSHSEVSSFGCSGIGEYNKSDNLIDSITLPDGTSYGFTYLTDGRISQITLPTGGNIQYTYPGTNNGVDCTYHTSKAITRTTSDGAVHKFIRTAAAAGNTYTSTYTDPVGNGTTFVTYQDTSSNFALVSRSTSLDQTVTCYNGATETSLGSTSCTAYYAPTSSAPITKSNAYYTLGTKHSATTTLLDTYGNVTDVYRYDWNNGSYPLVSHTATPRGTWNGSACAGIGNYINDRICYKNVYDGSGNLQASETFAYDTKGNLLTHVQATTTAGIGGSTLQSSFTYFANGVLHVATDVNGAQTTYLYDGSQGGSGCNGLLPTSVTNPLGQTASYTWDCVGGVLTKTSDLNGNPTTFSYGSDSFWRVTSTTDPLGNVTNNTYNESGAWWVTSSLLFNSNNSVTETGIGFDGLGRKIVTNHQQNPSGSTGQWDTIPQSYDSNGRLARLYMPCSSASWTCNTPYTSYTYDALNRPLVTTDGGGGTITYSHNSQDVLMTIAPAPAGENTKQRQYEYDGLGRLTSVCEITNASGSGACGQANTSGLNFTTGYVTSYTYDALNRLTQVVQNGQQTRKFQYDGLGRLTSETNPENGNVTYVYDTQTAPSCSNGPSAGDLVQKTDAAGNITCYAYDKLHRPVLTGNCVMFPQTGISHSYVYDSAVVNGVTMGSAVGRLAEAYTQTCPVESAGGTAKVTDEGFSYDADGRLTDLYESTPHSGGYYHTTAGYFPNGALNSLSGIPGKAAWTYNVDGEGRLYTAVQGTTNFVTNTTFNAASQPKTVSLGLGDSDNYGYDSAGRMNNFTFTVGSTPKSLAGSPTWNPNGTLGTLKITDGFYGGGTQTCNFGTSSVAGYDDLGRLLSANCGSAWNQSFSYDAFGNVTKSGSISWMPGYNPATNQYTLAGTSYDGNGNLLTDTFNTYTWDPNWGTPLSITPVSTRVTVNLTYDALGRMVETASGTTYTEILYSPVGKTAVMNGQALTRAYIPLPGGETAYVSSNNYFWHKDWLGSVRLSSNLATRTVSFDRAFAPFGETYNNFGSTEGNSFAGDTQDAVSGTYDTWNRELNPTQGRWISPDPAGLSAVDPTNPQSWNRYAYVSNTPCSATDPLGLADSCKFNVQLNYFPSTGFLSSSEILPFAQRIEDLFAATQGLNGETVGVNWVGSLAGDDKADRTITIYSDASWYMNWRYDNPMGAQSTFLSPRVYWSNIVGPGALQGPAILAGGAAFHELAHELGGFNDTRPTNPNDPNSMNAMNFDYAGNNAQFSAFQHADSPLWRLSSAQISQLYKNCKNRQHFFNWRSGLLQGFGWDEFEFLDLTLNGTEVVTHRLIF